MGFAIAETQPIIALILRWRSRSAWSYLPLAAAFDNDSATDALPELMVTASKIETAAQNSTQSVTLITEEEIRERNFTDTTEILRQATGIQFKQAGGPGQFNYPKLRGFGSGQFLVVVDGVKISEALSPGTGNFLGQIDPKLIEKIEICAVRKRTFMVPTARRASLRLPLKALYPALILN
jgi:outer membrane cobalamin receptor